ncbi:hypothetical protein AB0F17_62035 [Nonomuraea sp. NPDC026600]|uniref:hypothetical protein n=1 Tax=Nonomuraea sp. NPDC026600 TaxID=3155363 RepID=UPI0033FBCB14
MPSISFIPFDADATSLTAHLEASPHWEDAGTTYGGRVRMYDAVAWPDQIPAGIITVPIPGVPADRDIPEETIAHVCATAAHRINAHALGLPYGTSLRAVRRLVRVVNATAQDTALRGIYDIAAGHLDKAEADA